jgi:glutamine amidotransferase
MLVIIDYGLGNLQSISNMLKKIGVQSEISSDPSRVELASKLILPGVGAFDTGMNNIINMGLDAVLSDKVLTQKTPILGICLGMQLFANRSEEGSCEGLGWIDANIVKFDSKKLSENLKIPNMGWNTIEIKQNAKIVEGFNSEPRFYFVHSYHMVNSDNLDIIASSNYGYNYSSVVQKNNIVGVQFHPEKSHKYGMQLLKNFVENY